MAGQDIGARIGLQGDADFRRSLKLITQQCQELDAEMKRVTSSFDANDRSQEKLAAQSQVLGRQIDTQKKKINLLNDQYDKTTTELGRLGAELQEATQAYGAQSKEATRALAAYQNQATEVSRLQTNINKATTALNKMEQEQSQLTQEMNSGDDAFDKLTQAAEEQEAELNRLKRQYANLLVEQKGATDEAQDLARQINTLSSELEENRKDLKRAADAADELDRSMDDLDDSSGRSEVSLGSLGDIIGGNIIVDGVKEIVGAIDELHEASMEYRRIMSSLELSSKQAGYSTAETAESYDKLVGVLGDTQMAATTTQNLQAIGLEQEDLNRLIDISIGAWAKYGDSIPIDGLAESINETAKTGEVTGVLADALNWATGEEDAFNEELATTKDTSERARKIIEKLSKNELEELGQQWQENNQGMMDYNQASDDLDESMAELGETLEPVLTLLKEGMAQLISLVNDGMTPGVLQLKDAIGQMAEEAGLDLDSLLTKYQGLTAEQQANIQETINASGANMMSKDGLILLNEEIAKLTENTAAATEGINAEKTAAEENTVKMGEQITAFQNLSATQQQLAIDITNSVLTMQSNLQNSVQTQLGLFDQLDTGVETSMADILAGLDSQIIGVEQWENNLNTLISWGINQDLLQQLIEAGPKTGSAVQAIVDAGEGEIGKLNEKWSMKEDILNLTNEAGQTLKANGTEYIGQAIAELEGSTQADLDALKSVMSDGFKETGEFSSQGLAEGILQAKAQATDASEQLGEDVTRSLESVMEVASPSQVTKRIGEYTSQGMAQGIQTGTSQAINAAMQLARNVENAVRNNLNHYVFYSAGLNASYGMASGIRAGRSSVVNAAASVAASAASAARSKLQTHSPSKVFEEIGEDTTAGFAEGIDNSKVLAELERSMNAMLSRAQAITMTGTDYTPITQAIQAIPAGNTDIQIIVNAADGQSAEEIANAVMWKMQHAVQQKKAVWG